MRLMMLPWLPELLSLSTLLRQLPSGTLRPGRPLPGSGWMMRRGLLRPTPNRMAGPADPVGNRPNP